MMDEIGFHRKRLRKRVVLAEGKSSTRMMRMRELTAATGVTKATVLHYIKEGLIPKPIKPSKNVAFYNDSHVNAIRLVKELQSKRFLPLSVIKQVMKGGRGGLTIDEIRTLVEMNGKLFRNIQEAPRENLLLPEELSERTGVSMENIRIMERAKMIHPIKKGKKKFFEEDDIRIVECYGKMQEAGYTSELGFDASVLRIHLDLMKILVEEEAKLLLSRVSGRIDVQDIPKMVEEATARLNSIMGLFHKKEIIATAKRYAIEFREKDAVQDPEEMAMNLTMAGKK